MGNMINVRNHLILMGRAVLLLFMLIPQTSFAGSDINENILKYDGANNQWKTMPGKAIRVGGPNEKPWVVNNKNEIFTWDGKQWVKRPGDAYDVGDGWVIGKGKAPGGYSIFRWNYNSNSWDKMPGGAVRIGGSYTNPWVVNNLGKVYQGIMSPGKPFIWKERTGIVASDVGDGWIIEKRQSNRSIGGVYRWNKSMNRWEKMYESGKAIGGTYEKPFVIDSVNRVAEFRRGRWFISDFRVFAKDVGDFIAISFTGR